VKKYLLNIMLISLFLCIVLSSCHHELPLSDHYSVYFRLNYSSDYTFTYTSPGIYSGPIPPPDILKTGIKGGAKIGANMAHPELWQYPDDCQFMGWNTEADGSGLTFNVTSTVNRNIEVFAQWIPELPQPYGYQRLEIPYNEYGGHDEEGIYNYQITLPLSAAPLNLLQRIRLRAADGPYKLKFTGQSNYDLDQINFDIVDTTPAANYWRQLSGEYYLSELIRGTDSAIPFDHDFTITTDATSMALAANCLVIQTNLPVKIDKLIIYYSVLELVPPPGKEGEPIVTGPVPDVEYFYNQSDILLTLVYDTENPFADTAQIEIDANAYPGDKLVVYAEFTFSEPVPTENIYAQYEFIRNSSNKDYLADFDNWHDEGFGTSYIYFKTYDITTNGIIGWVKFHFSGDTPLPDGLTVTANIRIALVPVDKVDVVFPTLYSHAIPTLSLDKQGSSNNYVKSLASLITSGASFEEGGLIIFDLVVKPNINLTMYDRLIFQGSWNGTYRKPEGLDPGVNIWTEAYYNGAGITDHVFHVESLMANLPPGGTISWDQIDGPKLGFRLINGQNAPPNIQVNSFTIKKASKF
jgi:hypothetical protein